MVECLLSNTVFHTAATLYWPFFQVNNVNGISSTLLLNVCSCYTDDAEKIFWESVLLQQQVTFSKRQPRGKDKLQTPRFCFNRRFFYLSLRSFCKILWNVFDLFLLYYCFAIIITYFEKKQSIFAKFKISIKEKNTGQYDTKKLKLILLIQDAPDLKYSLTRALCLLAVCTLIKN